MRDQVAMQKNFVPLMDDRVGFAPCVSWGPTRFVRSGTCAMKDGGRARTNHLSCLRAIARFGESPLSGRCTATHGRSGETAGRWKSKPSERRNGSHGTVSDMTDRQSPELGDWTEAEACSLSALTGNLRSESRLHQMIWMYPSTKTGTSRRRSTPLSSAYLFIFNVPPGSRRRMPIKELLTVSPRRCTTSDMPSIRQGCNATRRSSVIWLHVVVPRRRRPSPLRQRYTQDRMHRTLVVCALGSSLSTRVGRARLPQPTSIAGRVNDLVGPLCRGCSRHSSPAMTGSLCFTNRTQTHPGLTSRRDFPTGIWFDTSSLHRRETWRQSSERAAFVAWSRN